MDREKDAESRSRAEDAFDLDAPVMLGNNAVGNRQAQPGSFANFLGGEEWFKQPVHVFGRDA